MDVFSAAVAFWLFHRLGENDLTAFVCISEKVTDREPLAMVTVAMHGSHTAKEMFEPKSRKTDDRNNPGTKKKWY